MTLYSYIRYSLVKLVHSVYIIYLFIVRDEVSSFWSSCRCALFLVLPFGVAALPVMGVFVCVVIGLHQSRVYQISFGVHPLFVGLLAGGDWFQYTFFAFFGVGGVAVLWLAWILWGFFLVYCLCVWEALLSMLAGTDGS